MLRGLIKINCFQLTLILELKNCQREGLNFIWWILREQVG